VKPVKADDPASTTVPPMRPISPSSPRLRPLARRATWLPLLLALALVAGACGGGDDEDTTDTTRGGGVVDEDVESTSDPVPGGALVYGIGAETDGWNPVRNAWAPEGIQVARAVYDPLAMFDPDGVAQPFLAESIEANAEYTEWTIRLRSGVTFHNGDPLTAEAVRVTLEGHRDSALTAPTMAPLERVEVVDDLTAVVHMRSPWVAFPAILTAQVGVIPHPSIIEENVNDAPIGTGPFQFVEWVIDDRFVAEKNTEYWRDGLPYLDRIEFRPLIDFQSRRAAFESGDIDVFLGGAPDDILEYRERAESGDDVQYYADRGENEEGFVQLNLEQPPFDDPRVREALAYATDAETYNQVVDRGALRIARGPFVPENPFFVDTDFPTFDLARAQELVAEIEADTGEPVSFTFANTPDDLSQRQSSVLQEMWEAAGFEVELEFTEQTQFILDALAGDYQANAWRQFGSPDPDGDYQWWQSESDLNFARLRDAEIDQALDQGRESADFDTRAQAYATLQERFTALLPYIWLAHMEWGIIAKPWVQDIDASTLPDGSPAKPFVTGTHRVDQIWIDETLL
jgi:peptide/nickel transport system substrate-binding protein